MPDDQELETFVQELIAKGESQEVINSVIDQWDTANPAGGPTPPKPLGGRATGIQPDTRGPVAKTVERFALSEGVPGFLAGAVKQGVSTVGQWDDVVRAGWNMVAPESMQAERPYQTEAFQRGVAPANPYQQLGKRGLQAAELIPVVKTATAVPGIVSRALGMNKARAVANLEEVSQAAKAAGLNVPLTPGTNEAAMRALQLKAAGHGNLPRQMTAFFDRLTNPKVTQYRGDDLTFQEAHDFASAFSRLTPAQLQSIPGAMRAQMAKMAAEVRQSAVDAANTIGKGDQYAAGVGEYAKAARAAEVWNKLKSRLIQIGGVGGSGGLAYGAYQAFKKD